MTKVAHTKSQRVIPRPTISILGLRVWAFGFPFGLLVSDFGFLETEPFTGLAAHQYTRPDCCRFGDSSDNPLDPAPAPVEIPHELQHRIYSGPTGSRFAGKSHARSGRRSSRTAPWAGPPFRPVPPPVNMKRSSCATTTRKVYLGKGVLKAVENVNAKIAPELIGLDVRDQETARRADDRDGRHAQQGHAGRERHAGCLDGRSPKRPRRRADCLCTGTSAAPPPHAAGADDEHPQRRQARRQQRRFPGVHDPAVGVRQLQRRLARRASRSITR